MLSRNYRKVRNRSPEETVELYNLADDPSETVNVAFSYQDVVESLKQFGMLNYERMVPPSVGIHKLVIVSNIFYFQTTS